MGRRVEIGFKLKITCFDTIINYHLFQKFKLLGNGEFKYLAIILKNKIVVASSLIFYVLLMVRKICWCSSKAGGRNCSK